MSLVSTNSSKVSALVQAKTNCKSTAVAQSINIIMGSDRFSASDFGAVCTNIDGRQYTGSNGVTYTAHYKGDSYVGSAAEQMQQITDSIQRGVPIVVAVHKRGSGTKHHWVTLLSRSGDTFDIIDPWGGRRATMAGLGYDFGLADSSPYHYGFVSFSGGGSAPTPKPGDLPSFMFDADLPSFMFDADLYFSLYPDLQKAFGRDEAKLRKHYLDYGIKEGRVASPVFDPRYYIAAYPDLQQAFGDDWSAAYRHFLEYGIHEMRHSSPLYCGSYYKQEYGDLQKAFGDNAPKYAEHFMNYGRNEGRHASPFFDPQYYISQYPDLQKAFGSAWPRAYKHFLEYGLNEFRRSSPGFSLESYRNRYEDLQKAFGGDGKAYIQHYIRHGAGEGRNPAP